MKAKRHMIRMKRATVDCYFWIHPNPISEITDFRTYMTKHHMVNNPSFLHRFSSKISTVTATGQLAGPNGQLQTSVVRVGPRRRTCFTKSSEDSRPLSSQQRNSKPLVPSNIPSVGQRIVNNQHPRYEEEKRPKQRVEKGHSQEPLDRNEIMNAQRRIDNPLAFSKKARTVKYTPCTVSEFKREHLNNQYYELGKLQPDLQDKDLVAKRDNQERIKAFSKNLRQINRQQQKSHQPRKNNLTKDTKELSKREKAKAFARTVPRPRVVLTLKENGDEHDQACGLPETRQHSPRSGDHQASKLDTLQLQHRTIQAEVDDIMKELDRM